MAINLNPINEQRDVYRGQIVIDQNFQVVQAALNDVFRAFNRDSGRFNNAGYNGSSNDIRTKAIVVTKGNVTLNQGNLRLNTGKIEARGATATIGFGGGSYFEKVVVGATSANFNVVSFKGNSNHGLSFPAITPSEMEAMKQSGELPVWSLAVMVGGTGATGATGLVLFDGSDWWRLDMTSI